MNFIVYISDFKWFLISCKVKASKRLLLLIINNNERLLLLIINNNNLLVAFSLQRQYSVCSLFGNSGKTLRSWKQK